MSREMGVHEAGFDYHRVKPADVDTLQLAHEATRH